MLTVGSIIAARPGRQHGSKSGLLLFALKFETPYVFNQLSPVSTNPMIGGGMTAFLGDPITHPELLPPVERRKVL